MLAALYQRGLTFEEALRNQELMYINFWNKKDKEVKTLESLLEFQKVYMLRDSPEAEIRFLEGVQNQHVEAKTLIRRFKKKTYPTPEYTGFVEFEDFIFMCVLFSPEQLAKLMIAVDPAGARKHFVAAQTTFRKALPPGHQVFAVLRSALRELGRKDKPHPRSMS